MFPKRPATGREDYDAKALLRIGTGTNHRLLAYCLFCLIPSNHDRCAHLETMVLGPPGMAT